MAISYLYFKGCRVSLRRLSAGYTSVSFTFDWYSIHPVLENFVEFFHLFSDEDMWVLNLWISYIFRLCWRAWTDEAIMVVDSVESLSMYFNNDMSLLFWFNASYTWLFGALDKPELHFWGTWTVLIGSLLKLPWFSGYCKR